MPTAVTNAEIHHLETIANRGPVTDKDVTSAVMIYQQWKDNPVAASQHDFFFKVLTMYALAESLNRWFQVDWWSIDADAKAKRRQLEDLWLLYVDEGMRGLLETTEALSDGQILYLAQPHGLGEWLEDRTIENLLFALGRVKGQVTRNSLRQVASRLGRERFEAMSAFVEGLAIAE